MAGLSIDQISTILNTAVAQASGQPLAEIDRQEFISVAQTALLTGYDKVLNALSQQMTRTIFSIRPYTRKLGMLQVDNEMYGNHIRKIQPIDKPFVDNDEYNLIDGQAIDQWIVNKPKVVQTNFYGEKTYSKMETRLRNQVNTALRSPAEFGEFTSMLLTNINNQIEEVFDTEEMLVLSNLMAGANKVKLLTEYNNSHPGSPLTLDEIMKPENFTPFWRFAYALIKYYSELFERRTTVFHRPLNAGEIKRHTPRAYQRLVFNSFVDKLIDSVVLSTTYNDEYLRELQYTTVPYWQSPDKPLRISGKFTSMNSDGTLNQYEVAESEPFLAVLFDWEAAGYTVCNYWSETTPLNARGGYYNMFWHFTNRFWNDFTENCVVFELS